MPEIREISALETFPVRHPVLRNGKPIESCHFDGDNLHSTKHFGLYENGILAGVISVFKVKNPGFTNELQFQIRGMAVLEDYRKRGFGELLVSKVENYVLGENGHFIWFNARENAIGFYQNLNYEISGNSFDITDVGIHFLMLKKLL